MSIKDLITDASSGQLSHTKLWANIAYTVGTWAFVWQAYKRELTDMLLFAYLGCVAGSALASKIVSYRYAGQNSGKQNPLPIDNENAVS